MSKYEYIDSCRNDPAETNPVTKMCAWLVVSTSGFYHWLSRPQSATAARRDVLTVRVKHFFAATPTGPMGTAGSMPIWPRRTPSAHRSWCVRSCVPRA